MTSPATIWLVIIGGGIITFGLRAGSLILAERLPDSPLLHSFLRYVPTAVLTAIIFPELFAPGGVVNVSPFNSPRLAAGLLALLIAWQTKKALPTIIVGMAALWFFMRIM